MKVRNQSAQEKIELQMTPMIDIVFQLLIFFIMTFKIVSQEGDFDIKMPEVAQGQGSIDDTSLKLVLELKADSAGNLNQITLNERPFNEDIGDPKLSGLHGYIVSYMGDDPNKRDTTELEIKADYQLRYEHIIAALTAVRGYRRDDGSIKDLITNVKFAPPGKDPDAGG